MSRKRPFYKGFRKIIGYCTTGLRTAITDSVLYR
nr:MAG TPA: hypothetical protein [Caudoviricetes sp.]